MLFPALGRAGLERAEIYFLDAARGMVESGDWLVPRYRGEPFFDKPALAYWLMAAAMKWLGPTAAAGRAVSGLAALGVLAATAWLGARLVGRDAAVAGAIVLASTAAFMSFGRIAMADMLLALFTTLAVALTVRAWQAPATWVVPALGLALGLGFLAKGPIALLLAGLGLVLYSWQSRRERWPVTPLGLGLAAVLAAVAGLGWFVLVYLRLGAEPLAHFFLRENLERFATATYDTGRGALFYPAAYVAVGAPWSLLLPLAAWRALQPGPGDAGTKGARFLLLWAGSMLVPLSLSRGKLDYYLLPLLPALSLVVGRLFATGDWTRGERNVARGALAILGAAILAAPLLLARVDPAWISPVRRRIAVAAAVAGGLALLGAAWRARPRGVLAALGLTSGLVAFVFAAVVVPGFMADQPNRRIVRDVSQALKRRPTARVIVCEDPTRVQRDILFEARKAVEERCDLWAVVSERRPVILLVRDGEASSLRRARLRVRGRYRYLPATALGLEAAGGVKSGRLVLLTNDVRRGHARSRLGAASGARRGSRQRGGS
ncbi:MAG TPA: glycosyltransferase family 39 protein [Vicinamibacteria bacterium]|nr:glycosyltransferase family 39 protein [Vicinamibacteria bacterium]